MTDTEPPGNLRSSLYERVLAVAAIGLFPLVSIALARGQAAWGTLDPFVWLHLATVMTPLALTPVRLLRRHGDKIHRVLSWIWAVMLLATALLSFNIRRVNDAGLSFIHAFSVLTLVTVPILVLAARNHRIARHRRSVRGLVTGALLTAGHFTLIPGRELDGWLWN